MRLPKRARAMLLALQVISFAHIGNSQSYVLSSFSAEKELSSRQITSFFQDSKGFMWIGTEDGLNLYNANSIKSFKHDVKDKNSLINNYIQDICEDKNGNIWIGTATGADSYMPSQNKFVHFIQDNNKEPFGYKSKVYSDRKGNIWIGGNGLFKFNDREKKFKKIKNSFSNEYFDPRLSNIINGFYNDSAGRYWISTNNGVFLYNDENKKFTRFDVPPNDDNYKRFGILFKQVYEDKNGNLWVGTWGYGFFKILISQQKLLPVSGKAVVLTYTSQQLNGDQQLWYAADGLTGVDAQNKRQAKITYQNNNPYSIRNDAISVLYTDKQNQLWIGYAQSGVQILSPGNQLVRTYPISSKKDRHQISSVGGLLKTNTSLYVGGWYIDALCKLDNNFKVEKWWSYLPADKTKSSSNVGDIYADKNQNLWIATFNGLIQFDERTGKIQDYKFDSSVNINNRFLKILPEGDSVLWLAGYDNGLSRFSLTTRQLQMIGSNTSRQLFWKITFDKTGNIWCANNNGTLEKFDRQRKDFTTYVFDTLTESSIYYDIAFDSVDNKLWVSSSNGLLRVDPQNLHADLFTEKDGLPTTHANLLCFDPLRRLWIGTDKGLSLYDRQNNSFKNFYTNNGLSTEKIDHTLCVGADGKLYIGADNSVMVMNINDIEKSTEMSPVYITGVSEGGNLLQPEVKQNSKVIALPYNHNALSFEFAIADYINPEDNELLYQLENWDKDLIPTKKGEVSYNKLPPGKYIFRVKGINHNGIKNEKGDAVTIIIQPPFWRTWWFITFIITAALIFLVLAIRYISQRNLKDKLLRLEKVQAIEKERNRISKDMHDDLGSGLTKIAIMSEVVKKQMNEPEKARQQLENISASSRELVDNLQDIIWVLNPKNDTLENVAAYIREYSLKFFEPFETELHYGYPENFPDIKLSEETRRNIFLVMKESFNNIAKHAWCNKVTISIDVFKNEILLKIKDDGKGFDMNMVRQFGNGLVNMKNRIEKIGGKYEITTVPAKGTETFITVPV